jgi:hypothetical protein
VTIVIGCLLTLALLLLVAVLGRIAVLRRRLVRDPEVFRCSVRVLHGDVPGLPRGHTARLCRAQWRHDVLVLHRGAGLTWAQPLAVRMAEDVMEPAFRPAGPRLGPGAVQLPLRLDDGSVVLVAAPAVDAERLAGPFLAIAVRQQPPGLTGRRG